jgi:glycosyltransferase involved in cell wall biosynthesis
MNFKHADLPHFQAMNGINVVRYWSIPLPFKYVFLAPRLLKDLVQARVDVLEVFSMLPSFFVLAPILVSKIRGIPLVMYPIFNVHRSEHRGFWIRVLDQLFMNSVGVVLLKLADHVIATTEDEMRSCIRVGAIRTSLIYEGISVRPTSANQIMALQQKLDLTQEDAVLLSIGRVEERKGFDFLISAMPAIIGQFPSIKLVVVGRDWGYMNECKKLAKEIGCDNNVIFAGSLTDDELASAYNLADVVAIPSMYEGQSRIVLESFAHRKPLVTTTSVGPRELIRAGGIQIRFGDVKALERAISDLMSNEEKRNRLGTEGYRAVKDLNWGNRVEILEKIYAEIVPRSAR